MPATYHVLYFNGLGSGKTRKRERLAMCYLAKRGVEVEHVPIDWRSSEPFPVLLERVSRLVRERLKVYGQLMLVGSSAGGSLAINVLSKVHHEQLSVVTLCSRLHEAPLPRWDRRNLKRMAHIGVPGTESQSFHDSVTYCGDMTIPLLTQKERKRVITVQQWADFVVPRATMSIPGTHIYKVPGLGHAMGIAVGTVRLPIILHSAKGH